MSTAHTPIASLLSDSDLTASTCAHAWHTLARAVNHASRHGFDLASHATTLAFRLGEFRLGMGREPLLEAARAFDLAFADTKIPRRAAKDLTADGTFVIGGFVPRLNGTAERAHYSHGSEGVVYYAVVQKGEECPIWQNSEGSPL